MVDKIRVGNVEIVAVIDMVPPPRAPEDFFPAVSPSEWEPYKDDVLDKGLVQLYYGCFFVRSQGRTIMIDTGMGPGPHLTRDNRTGDLLNQLKLNGVDPEDVSTVVHSHLHADHVGWNLKYSGGKYTPYFPNARYLVPRVDWEYFTRPDIIDSAPQVTENVAPLEELQLMDLIDDGHNVTDELTTLSTPGHTPGHQVVLISSQGEKAMIVGDAIHNKVQVQEPSWCAGVDTDKVQSHQSREGLLSRAEAEDYVIAAGHFHPTQHIGKIVRMQGRRYWQAL